MVVDSKEVEVLYNDIKTLIEESKKHVYRAVNKEMLNSYWSIGKSIIEKQGGVTKTKYGDYLINETSVKLINKFRKN